MWLDQGTAPKSPGLLGSLLVSVKNTPGLLGSRPALHQVLLTVVLHLLFQDCAPRSAKAHSQGLVSVFGGQPVGVRVAQTVTLLFVSVGSAWTALELMFCERFWLERGHPFLKVLQHLQ